MNNKKLETLEKVKKDLNESMRELRMKLVSSEPEIITEIDKDIGKLRVKLQRATQKNEYLANMLVEVQTGISHFNERLDVIQFESEDEPVDENNFIEILKRLSQKAKMVYQVIERNRHFNELCKSKVPLVNENDLITSFANSNKKDNK